MSKYGDCVMEIIEVIIKEYYKLDKNGSSSNDSVDLIKRRRDVVKFLNIIFNEDEDLIESIGRLKKRLVKVMDKSIGIS